MNLQLFVGVIKQSSKSFVCIEKYPVHGIPVVSHHNPASKNDIFDKLLIMDFGGQEAAIV